MNPTTQIRLQDLRYYYIHKPMTYGYLTEKLKERINDGETVELILEDSTIFQPANANRLEKFLLDEVGGQYK